MIIEPEVIHGRIHDDVNLVAQRAEAVILQILEIPSAYLK